MKSKDPIKKIDIKITFKCTNNCSFCAQGHKRLYHKDKQKKEVFKALRDGIKRGAKTVVFTGGEPSLHKNIVDFVRYAKELGYETIQLQTNAQIISDMVFLKKLVKNGLNEVSPALHGFYSDTHNKLTKNPKSYELTLKGIVNSVKLGLSVVTNTVVTSINYKELPKLASLFVKLKVTQFQFAFIHVVGTALKNKSWIVPRKIEVMPYVKKGLDIGLGNKVLCFTEAIPFCLMQGYEQCVVERNIPDTYIIDAGFKVENYGIYRKEFGKVKSEKCLSCKYYDICEGPWKEYPDIYGWDEFQPVYDFISLKD